MPSLRRASLLLVVALLLALLPPARSTLAASFVVTSLADTNTTGTLRWAITQANASTGPHTITFSTFGRISLTTVLPTITRDGITINGEQGGAPGIEIDGSAISIPGSGLLIRGLILSGFQSGLVGSEQTGAGIEISGASSTADNNLIQNCYLGTNAAGTAPATVPNQTAGLIISGTSPDERLVEIIEITDHPFFVASQYHPEFKSRPERPAPLFRDFVDAALAYALEQRPQELAAEEPAPAR